MTGLAGFHNLKYSKKITTSSADESGLMEDEGITLNEGKPG